MLKQKVPSVWSSLTDLIPECRASECPEGRTGGGKATQPALLLALS